MLLSLSLSLYHFTFRFFCKKHVGGLIDITVAELRYGCYYCIVLFQMIIYLFITMIEKLGVKDSEVQLKNLNNYEKRLGTLLEGEIWEVR